MQHEKHLTKKKKKTRRIQSLNATHRSGVSRCEIDFLVLSTSEHCPLFQLSAIKNAIISSAVFVAS